MPSHVHTCAACGNSMVIPERMLGRELRCTSCRVPFTVSPPAPEASLPAMVEPARPRRWPAVAIGCAGLLAGTIALLMWFFGPSPGEVGRGRSGSLGATCYAGLDRAAVVEVARLASSPGPARDQALRRLLDEYRVVEVPAGTRLVVMTRGNPDEPVQVQLLSGRWSGKKVWVKAAWVQ